MPTYVKEINIDRREIIRSLGAFSNEELREMLAEQKEKLQANIHLETETEVGRQSTSLILQNITVHIDAIMYVLNRRMALTDDEKRDWLSARPHTHIRMILNPFRGNNL